MPNLKHDAVEINPKEKPTHSVIWLHGLGADGHDFESVAQELRLPKDLAIRFVFPHAPKRPVSLNGGFMMRAWYDIFDLDFKNRNEDEAGIHASEAIVRQLIENEKERGILSENIVLAGFSQGGAMALQVGLRYEEKLAGILDLSGYLLLSSQLEKEKSPSNQSTSIMMAHGTMDNIIPIQFAKQSRDRLLEQGYSVGWKEYEMAHSVCLNEINDIRAWFVKVFE
jgi:phospholipase/carboxylesterase